MTTTNNNFTRSCVSVTTGNDIKIVNYPEDTGCSDDFIRKQLGNGCRYLDEVRPNRLYNPCPACYSGIPGSNAAQTEAAGQNPFMGMIPRNFGFHYPLKPYYDGGNILMLVDDLGYDKGLPDNPIASWLYGADVHGNCIKGNVLFVGCTSDFDDYCGIARRELSRLVAELRKLKQEIEGK